MPEGGDRCRPKMSKEREVEVESCLQHLAGVVQLRPSALSRAAQSLTGAGAMDVVDKTATGETRAGNARWVSVHQSANPTKY